MCAQVLVLMPPEYKASLSSLGDIDETGRKNVDGDAAFIAK